MKLDKCAFISDLDNTLLDSNLQISEKNIAAIKKFKQLGGHFSIATGRAPVAAHKYMGLLGIDQGIFCGGAMIYNFKQDKAVWQVSMGDEAKQAVLDILERFENASVQVYTVHDIFMVRTNPILFNKGAREEHRFFPTHIDEISGDWLKFSVTDSTKEIPLIHEFFAKNYPQLICVSSDDHFNEITSRNASKGAALKAFCKLHDIPLKRTAVVGDSEIDISMFEGVGISMAVSNASKTVLQLVDKVLPNHDKDAIAKGIEMAMQMFG